MESSQHKHPKTSFQKRWRKKIYTFFENPFTQRIIVSLIALYLRFVYITSRKTIIHSKDSQDFISVKKHMLGCFWHGRLCLAPILWQRGRYPISVIISKHNDGQIISNTIQKLHIDTITGSTGKDGIKALKEIVHTVKNDHSVCFTPDGPRGPAFSVGEGVIAAAKLSGVPIISAGLSAKFAKKINSWDSFFIPLPFSKIAIVWGNAISVPKETKNYEFKIYAKQLEDEMNRITTQADALCGHEHHLNQNQPDKHSHKEES